MTTSEAVAILAIVVVIGAAVFGIDRSVAMHSPPVTDGRQRVEVVRVKDGDTFVGRIGGREVTIRCGTFDARESDEPGGDGAAKLLGIATKMRSTGKAKKVVDEQWAQTEHEIARLEEAMASGIR